MVGTEPEQSGGIVTMAASLSVCSLVLVRNPAKGLIVSQRLQSKSVARDVEQPVQSIELDSKFELLDVLDRDWRPYLDPLGASVLCKQGLGVVFDGVPEKGLESPHWLSPV
jgi:hypothetical protein